MVPSYAMCRWTAWGALAVMCVIIHITSHLLCMLLAVMCLSWLYRVQHLYCLVYWQADCAGCSVYSTCIYSICLWVCVYVLYRCIYVCVYIYIYVYWVQYAESSKRAVLFAVHGNNCLIQVFNVFKGRRKSCHVVVYNLIIYNLRLSTWMLNSWLAHSCLTSNCSVFAFSVG
jgi:hypothetical protein